MAEEVFEPHYHHHLPQQSRRDKLRLSAASSSLLTTPNHSSPTLLPLYDPSLLLTNFPNHNNNNHNMDPQSSLHEDVNNNSNNPFFFTPQNLRVVDQSFNGGEGALVCKPEPLSLSLFSNDLSTRWGPLGPFMGYALILKSSRFLKPAQQLLEEICDVGRGIYGENFTAETGLMEPPEGDSGGGGIGDESVGEERRMKSRLISMLDEVYKRYKYYYQQVQAVVASFESVAGLSNAAPYANLALKAMARQFRSLKNAITDQLQFTSKAQKHRKDETPRFGNSDSLYSQRPVHNSGFLEHQPVWRSQRGLPERAVSVLKSWLFEHFLHPYPTDADKLMLAKQTGLSRSQVSNWFINARVRLWKPMVEEVHMLETRQAPNVSQGEEQNVDRPIAHLPSGISLSSENPSTSTKRTQDLPSKRTRNEFPNTSMGTEEAMSLSYENVSAVCGGRGVSLTLGLHQNNGIVLSEAFPIAAARRFGLDASSEGYVLGSLEVQNRQFGRDVIGGQLLRDFVG